MRLVFIFHDRPNYLGGPIVNARRLLPELVRRGHEVHCLMFYGGHAAPSACYLEQRGVFCYSRPILDSSERHIRWILHKLAELTPDVFIPNLSVAGWFAARWAREAGIPTVAVMRSGDAYHWAMVEQFVSGPPEWAVSGLVCVAERLYEGVLQHSPQRTNCCVIPSGVPVSARSSDQTGALRLVYVGRLVEEAKRILSLVDALALVLHRNKEIRASLIGDGELRLEVLQRIERHGLVGRLDVLGAVSNEELQDQLVDFDVLVLLSDYEGTPGAVMDGMAAGLIPVCLDIPGGVRELVIHQQTGLLVSDRQQSFVDAIEQLAHDAALRKKLSANAKDHVAKCFSLNVAADRWESFCCELVSAASVRLPLVVPAKFALPPVRAGLDREDKRSVSMLRRAVGVLVRLIRRGMTWLLNWEPKCLAGRQRRTFSGFKRH